MELGKISFFDFTNMVMSNVYKLTFNAELERLSEDMKNKLQLSSKIIGDCFSLKDHTIITTYHFSEAPYILLTFLTSRIFALEFIRQRLHSENEHFINFKKASNIKYHYNIGPFVIKVRSSLPVIEKFLKAMNFKEVDKIRYDPKQVISQRRKKNKYTPYEHEEVQDLGTIANLENPKEGQQMIDVSEKVQNSQDGAVQVNPFFMEIQTPSKNLNKKPFLEVVDMEVDEHYSSKRTKITAKDKVMVYLEQEESINQGGPTIII